ncbi:DNA-directed RNA polymerase III subunit RPC3 isoform X2 [Iris pallida]|uniref:DNA-directed RNA polymerase III subunit RPC3 n=1 Tax=Iris pallida TaxID=29817 RepID=A0AAX6F4Z1_IRIPA|nr:DNA-directed RNA polymerase III subunit RPC3 isoform X2 [Iris pallida]
MVAQQGLAHAETIVKSHFGEIVSKVVGCLLHRGSLALPEIVRFVRLPPPQVRSSLLVLIQHNCVQAFSIERPAGLGGAIRNVTQYTALFYNILQRMRFTKFSAIVNADLGEQCEYLLDGLLQHGRLTFDQLAVRVTLKHPGAIRNDIRKNFNRLIHANYVERCPFSEPSIKPEDVPSSGKKRSKIIYEARLLNNK